jgi:membrane-bound lytic murein transglycosylase MltF
MQVLPSTARDASVRILDISKPDKNIEAGVKYLKHLHDMYYASDKISSLDQVLFSLAAYNAGPGNIAKARRRAKSMGLNPNVWFENVEIAAASSISHEPVTYVRNIFKYYVGFKAREALREERQDILPVSAPEDPEPQD